ncbi:MAG: hypothetical protein ACRDGE_10255 [Candidatus Limnocylindria bacterium]
MDKREPDPAELNTVDLDCAAFLISQGAELIGIEANEPAAKKGLRLRGPRVREDAESFVLGQATVRLDVFLDARRALLDRLHRAERVR